MNKTLGLHHYLIRSANLHGHRNAVEDSAGRSISYRDLNQLSDRLCDRLRHQGVGRGDRVGLYLHKSIDAIAAIFGVLKTGAAYVPVDPLAPASRNAFILNNCSVKTAIVEAGFVENFQSEVLHLGSSPPQILMLDGTSGGRALSQALDVEAAKAPAISLAVEECFPTDLAYILYTSGSTGRPKGVMLSHVNGTSFVDWCSAVFEPTCEDRFSSHAPLHFDLSILDIYLSIKHGSTLVLVAEDFGKDPVRLARFICEQRMSIWYSAPSILSLLANYGNLHQFDYSSLRMVLFAGEVFPVKHLRALQSLLPRRRYFNLYGPTETNVCTFFEVPTDFPVERTKPFPIGKTCSHLQAKVVDEQEIEVAHGQEGELCISGPGVTQGYWDLEEQTEQAFLKDASPTRWYKTGDIVVEEQDGNFTYVGRRDRMVKKRGYRVELGEIEVALYRHVSVREAAVTAFVEPEEGVKVRAFLCCRGEKRPSIIELKRFCSDNLPIYMVPDVFSFHDHLPKTSTDKIDYQKLKEMK